ncbi:hypothetical protein [Thermosulfurimonas sp. F29]|uniref:hypothetical protein n=1 Tax=Thermosulfurimonas sp. F29 TaxID=2867247 RepID=UPI001C83FAA4|nr:hypothetical protein [Thermosulfurimonas sp. F29]MBX6423533.1 hypothetical protein [Thermosulfurimonas sp. F29]
MRKVFFVLALVVLLNFSLPARSEVLSTTEKEVYAVYLVPAPRAFPTELGYVITSFGPGNINFLERVDVVVDREGRLQGIQLVYTPPDGFRRHVFLAGKRSLIVQEARPGSLKKKVLFRVITSDELNRLD